MLELQSLDNRAEARMHVEQSGFQRCSAASRRARGAEHKKRTDDGRSMRMAQVLPRGTVGLEQRDAAFVDGEPTGAR